MTDGRFPPGTARRRWGCKPDSGPTPWALIIYLGPASPQVSSGRFGDIIEPGRLSLRFGPCTGWGLPSCRCFHRHWCALTAPFHPYRFGACRLPTGGLLSVARAVALRAQLLAGTLPCGARTFLSGPLWPPRSDTPPCESHCSIVDFCPDRAAPALGQGPHTFQSFRPFVGL